MNRFFKASCMLLCLAISLGGAACGGGGNSSDGDGSSGTSAAPAEANCRIYPTQYEGIQSLADSEVNAYAGEAATNLPVENGVVYSPYYSLTINGEDVPVYATRTANGIHSFAYVDVEVTDESKAFALNAEVTTLSASSVLSERNPVVVVLPESSGVTAEIGENKITSVIRDFGSFSFAFNRNPDEALTLFVTEKEVPTPCSGIMRCGKSSRGIIQPRKERRKRGFPTGRRYTISRRAGIRRIPFLCPPTAFCISSRALISR